LVIFGDDVVGHAERVQDQRAGETGAVLAGGAMNHQRRAVLEQMREQRAEARRVVMYIAAIGIAHDLQRVARRQRGTVGSPRAQRRNDGRLDRQRMDRDLGNAAQRCCALLGAAKIERAFEAQPAQHLDIGVGEMAEMVGAEDLPPAHDATIAGGIAAKVAEIAGAGEVEVAGGGL